MLKYDHIGIPIQFKKEGMIYFPDYKLWTSDYKKSQYGIEWIYFEKGSPLHPHIQKMAHVCFVVLDIQKAIHGKKILLDPCVYENEYMAFIEDHDGAVIELLQPKG